MSTTHRSESGQPVEWAGPPAPLSSEDMRIAPDLKLVTQLATAILEESSTKSSLSHFSVQFTRMLTTMLGEENRDKLFGKSKEDEGRKGTLHSKIGGDISNKDYEKRVASIISRIKTIPDRETTISLLDYLADPEHANSAAEMANFSPTPEELQEYLEMRKTNTIHVPLLLSHANSLGEYTNWIKKFTSNSLSTMTPIDTMIRVGNNLETIKKKLDERDKPSLHTVEWMPSQIAKAKKDLRTIVREAIKKNKIREVDACVIRPSETFIKKHQVRTIAGNTVLLPYRFDLAKNFFELMLVFFEDQDSVKEDKIIEVLIQLFEPNNKTKEAAKAKGLKELFAITYGLADREAIYGEDEERRFRYLQKVPPARIKELLARPELTPPYTRAYIVSELIPEELMDAFLDSCIDHKVTESKQIPHRLSKFLAHEHFLDEAYKHIWSKLENLKKTDLAQLQEYTALIEKYKDALNLHSGKKEPPGSNKLFIINHLKDRRGTS